MAIPAYQRHGGVHQDQYRTAKQSRLDDEREIRDALAAEVEDEPRPDEPRRTS